MMIVVVRLLYNYAIAVQLLYNYVMVVQLLHNNCCDQWPGIKLLVAATSAATHFQIRHNLLQLDS